MTVLYALAVWSVSTIYSLLKQRREAYGSGDIVQGARLMILLVLASLLDAWLRSWRSIATAH